MKVVCIVAMVHSGTTLLDLVLGGHPRFVGLGELSGFVDLRRGHLGRINTQLCSCRRTLKDCPFWGPFSAELVRQPPASERASYELLLSAFHRHFGEDRVLVDSSKSIETVQTWAEVVGNENVRLILLVRDVRGWMTSMIELSKRMGEHRIRDLMAKFRFDGPKEIVRRSRVNRFRQWYRGNQRLQRFLESSSIDAFQLGYEELCLYSERMLDDLCHFLGVRPDPGMVSLAESGSHVVLGNRMKFEDGKRTGIRYDDLWMSRREWLLPATLLPVIMKYNAREVYRNVAADPWRSPRNSGD